MTRNDPVCSTPKDSSDTEYTFFDFRHMAVQLRFDRESFEALKTLLRQRTSTRDCQETATARMEREALKRVFDQLRDVKYNDGRLLGLGYE